MDKSLITLHAESLLPGESIRIDCPECDGKDQTLGITRMEDNLVLYQCFRASCEARGSLGRGTAVREKAIKRSRRTWEGSTCALPSEVLDWIKQEWGITDPPNWYYTSDYGGRIAMSIRSPSDQHRGWVLRNDGSSQPKALTYVEEGEDALSWYKTVPSAPTVLVEDIPSAVRASTYVNAVALCGTGIGFDRAREIADNTTGPVVVALDDDATQLSFKWAQKYSLLWGDVMVLPLKKDIKDMQEDEACDLLKGLVK